MSVSRFLSQSKSVWPAESVKMKINDQKKKERSGHTQPPVLARLAFGHQAKTVTNNLPLLSVLANRSVKLGYVEMVTGKILDLSCLSLRKFS
jgi:hypothetical protein